jgi:hypothetical protein
MSGEGEGEEGDNQLTFDHEEDRLEPPTLTTKRNSEVGDDSLTPQARMLGGRRSVLASPKSNNASLKSSKPCSE